MAQLVIPKTLESRETGDLVSFFKSYDDIVQKNSGIHDSKCLTIDCLEPQCPIPEGTYTKIKLTDESVDVVNLNKSWISMTVKATVTWSFQNNVSLDEATQKFYSAVGTNAFVGLKSSSHIIDSYRILNANRKTGCEQTQALYENSIVHFLKPEEEIQGRPNIYTPWENAFHHDQSVCGLYIPNFTNDYKCLWNQKEYTEDVEFELTIPIDDILPLSNISMYPNYLFGNLQMEFKTTSKKNFVWCLVNTEDAAHAWDLAGVSNGITEAYSYSARTMNKTFFQCGDTVDQVFIYTVGNVYPTPEFAHTTSKVNVSLSNLVITSCQSNINGFKIKDSVKVQLREKYSDKKLIIPSQFIDYQQTNNGPIGSTLQTSTSYTLTNVSNICVTFPRSENELTISRNPRMNAFQLFVDNKPYPDQIGSTTSARYCEYVLSNSYLDNLWCANKSLLYALSHRTSEYFNGSYLLNRDNSNYCFNAATERLCSGDGIYCDGLNKDISLIRLYGTLDSNSRYSSACPAPHIFFVQTTFWICSTDGVDYIMNDDGFLKREIEDNDN